MESLVGRSQDVYVMTEKRRKRRIFILTCLGGILVAALVLGLLIHLYINREYNGYQVKKTIKVKNSSTMQYMPYNGGVLRYSRDGVSAMNADGNDSWNGSYDMENPVVDICDSSVAVADIGGTDVFVYNEGSAGTEFTTDYPILQVCVSKQGVVAVMLEDTSSNMIQIYNPYDNSNKLLVEIPTNVEEGYPVSMDLSPEGTSLVASYVCITSGAVESRAAFYDFTEVGKNTNCLVGAQQYQDRVISEVRFLGASQVCLFSEKGFCIWEDMKKPKETIAKDFDEEIQSAFCNEDYIGVITESGKDSKSNLKLYDGKGKNIMSRSISSEYTYAMIDGKEILIHSADQCMIYRVNGAKKLQCSLDQKINQFFPAEGMNYYFLIRDSKLEKIKLHNQ